jgi:5-methylcytosine-specific restriction endonuclease McrA
MPFHAPRICGCGRKVPSDSQCACQKQRERERKARFDKTRPSARERGYDAKWDRERAAYLKVNKQCRRCGDPSTTVDHIQAHKGNQALFWNRSNWQPLCTPCHSRAKQAFECRAVA